MCTCGAWLAHIDVAPVLDHHVLRGAPEPTRQPATTPSRALPWRQHGGKQSSADVDSLIDRSRGLAFFFWCATTTTQLLVHAHTQTHTVE